MSVADYLKKKGRIYRPSETGRGLLNQPNENLKLIANNVKYFFDDALSPTQARTLADTRPVEQLIDVSLLIVAIGTDIQEGDVFELESGKRVSVLSAGNPGSHDHHLECTVLKSD